MNPSSVTMSIRSHGTFKYGFNPSYLHGHSALSRASSRHTGSAGLPTGSAPDSGQGSAHLTRATCGPRFSRLRLQTHGPIRVLVVGRTVSTRWSRSRVD